MSAVCRDCATVFEDAPERTCTHCGGTRFFTHPELLDLEIAHLDCDAFYALSLIHI